MSKFHLNTGSITSSTLLLQFRYMPHTIVASAPIEARKAGITTRYYLIYPKAEFDSDQGRFTSVRTEVRRISHVQHWNDVRTDENSIGPQVAREGARFVPNPGRLVKAPDRRPADGTNGFEQEIAEEAENS